MDYYQLLGVNPSTSKTKIKKAYYKLALQFHPDKHVNSPSEIREANCTKFKQISEAYQTLIDDDKRAVYDKERTCYACAQYKGNPRKHKRGQRTGNCGERAHFGYGFGHCREGCKCSWNNNGFGPQGFWGDSGFPAKSCHQCCFSSSFTTFDDYWNDPVYYGTRYYTHERVVNHRDYRVWDSGHANLVYIPGLGWRPAPYYTCTQYF